MGLLNRNKKHELPGEDAPIESKLPERDPVVLGRKYKDDLSGFTGVAVTRIQHLYGCVQVHLEAESKDENSPSKICGFDEQRLLDLDDKPPKATARAGAHPGVEVSTDSEIANEVSR